MEKILYTKRELAEMLGVSEFTIEYYRKKKGLPFLKMGKKTVKYDIADVREWLRQFRKSNTSLNP